MQYLRGKNRGMNEKQTHMRSTLCKASHCLCHFAAKLWYVHPAASLPALWHNSLRSLFFTKGISVIYVFRSPFYIYFYHMFELDTARSVRSRRRKSVFAAVVGGEIVVQASRRYHLVEVSRLLEHHLLFCGERHLPRRHHLLVEESRQHHLLFCGERQLLQHR